MEKDLLSIADLSAKDIKGFFILADDIKAHPRKYKESLAGMSLGMIFEKPSLRTRVSFEVGMTQLGGHALYLGPNDIKLGVREAVADVARTLSRYLHCIAARTFSHAHVIELAKYACIPVINMLSDFCHPCQVLADLYTIREKKKTLAGITVAWVGDGNNVLHSLLYGCGKIGVNLNIAVPAGYEPDEKVLKEAMRSAQDTNSKIVLSHSPAKAVQGADFIYTDVWASMGQEAEQELRKKAFAGFQVNEELIARAKDDVLVMHCLPAHRGEEIAGNVVDGPRAIVFDQSENRLHIQKAILVKLLTEA